MKTTTANFKMFEANRLDDLVEEKRSLTNYYQLQVFEFIWIKKGSGNFSIDFEKQEFTDNTFYCLLPGQIHRFEPKNELTGYRVAFSEDFLRTTNRAWPLPAVLNYIEQGEKLRVTNLSKSAQADIEEIIGKMLWEYNNDNQLKVDILHGLLKLLIAHFSDNLEMHHKNWAATQVYQLHDKFMATLEACYTKHKQVCDYAEELAISPSYLSEVVKRVSGYPASYHIQQRILLEAKRRAISENITMKKIAFDLGFDDPSTFSKFFKTCTGSTFSDFKLRHSKYV